MTSPRTTRLLIIAFVGLLLVAAAVNGVRQNIANSSVTLVTPLPYLFPRVQSTDITRMEIENHLEGGTLILTRVPGDWLGTDGNGKSVPVDLARVTRMIQILPTLRYNRIMEGSDVTAFGLANGGRFVVHFDARGSSYTLHIGELNSALTFAYVQPGDNGPIGQIPAADANSLVAIARVTGTPAP
jgi:hypothetical protein